ncbi:MSCRAMM family adhesin SdrC [Mammaliicoccus sciuri]|uniref:MSCRAMM family adhesin SdrC n=1 Tax=Mammaliicoccus sciuri TaxID=1296 RepID=UPI0021CF1354|nr:MSCRAMM family adhesin SdrC [Mammaliicoccus sciuri]UXV31325.1 MSCRAMM family adhesin SdrC [Mammaliicoccus sciuri]
MLKKIFLSTLLCTTITSPLIGKVNAEEVKQDKPLKYVFKSGGMRSPIGVNYNGSMTVPEQDGEILEIDAKPVDFYIYKDGVSMNEINPKYKYIWDQWGYYDFYKSKGRVNDLFVGEHPRPLDGVTYDPKSDKTSDDKKADDQKVEPKNDQPKDQTEPNKNTSDNQSKSDQPKQDVPSKVEQPAKDDGKVNKKSDSQSNVVDKKDTADQNKVVSNNKAVADNQKSDPQTSDVSKKVDVKKEDSNKDVNAKATDNKAKAADNKSDKQQKELPKTGESDSTWLRNGLVILSAFIVLGIYRLSRKYEVWFHRCIKKCISTC